MTTTLYTVAPVTKFSAAGYDIVQAGTVVPDGAVPAIQSAAYGAGVTINTSAGGAPQLVQVPSYYNGGTGSPVGDSLPVGAEVKDSTGAVFEKTPDGWVASGGAQTGTFASVLPTTGSFTYNTDGTIASDPDGNTYAWNADGTPRTQTKGGVTRTFNWNTDGTLASVS